MRLLHIAAARVAQTTWMTRAGFVLASVVVVAALGFALSRGGQPEVVVRAVGTAVATAPAESSSTPTGTPTPFPTGQPGQVVTTVKELVSKFGYPPGTNYATIRIPAIGVDARVGSRTVGRDAIMPAPNGPAEVVWYDMGLWDGLGGSPGAGQNAVFSGHVDYADPVPYTNVSYRGQAVFSQLHLLSQGDIIEVNYKGQTLRYKVEWRRQLTSGGQTDWGNIWASNTGADSITLYTCGGQFDFKTREYDDRVIVRAVRL